jgi:hypothetical protein
MPRPYAAILQNYNIHINHKRKALFMSVFFTIKDVMHKIAVKFVPAFLPDAKKPYNLKAVHQPELDIHGIASKAEVYNVGTSPKVIEEGLIAGMELIYYLAADGFKIKTPLFNLKIRVPGEYDGSETHLPDGVHPTARLQVSAAFRNYLKERVSVDFDGIDLSDGLIAEARDEATGLIDESATVGNILTIHGSGLKIDADEEHKGSVGLFFAGESGASPVKATVIAVNEPRTLKVVVPPLTEGAHYTLRVVTQTSAKGHSSLLKDVREMRSDFTVTAHS